MATLSVILPTCGRPTLSASIACLLPQLEAGDELLVVGDEAQGRQPYARGLCRLALGETRGSVVYVATDVPGSVFGNGQRDAGLRIAKGSHLCFLDDDDVYRPEALSRFRDAADLAPHAVHVFKAEWGPGHHAHGYVLWRDRAFVEQNVATPMVVYPNDRGHMPLWMDSNDRGTVSDFGWMVTALGTRRVEWHEKLVATVRPEAA